jgi:hypothetical protein
LFSEEKKKEKNCVQILIRFKGLKKVWVFLFLWVEEKEKGFQFFWFTEGFAFRKEKTFGKRVNDPSAGSSTETLLQLLLPLNDQV